YVPVRRAAFLDTGSRGAVLPGLAVGNAVSAPQVARPVSAEPVLPRARLALVGLLPLFPERLERGLYVHSRRRRLSCHRCGSRTRGTRRSIEGSPSARPHVRGI